jgi:hypothetical protein
MLRHLKRKYICKPKLKDIEISIIYNKYFNNNQQKKNDLEGNLSWYKCGTNDNKCIPLCPNINSKVDTIVSCRYCSKTFSDRHGRWKHEKLRCKRKNETFNITKKKDLIENVTNMLKEQYEVELRHKDKQIKELLKKINVLL